MPSIDLLDAFAELVVCVVFNLPHNLQHDSGDQNRHPLSQPHTQLLRDGHPLGSQCTTSDDDVHVSASNGNHILNNNSMTSNVNSIATASSSNAIGGGATAPSCGHAHAAQPSVATHGSSASLDMFRGSFAGLGRWTMLSRAASVNSLNTSSVGGDASSANGGGVSTPAAAGFGRWLGNFRGGGTNTFGTPCHGLAPPTATPPGTAAAANRSTTTSPPLSPSTQSVGPSRPRQHYHSNSSNNGHPWATGFSSALRSLTTATPESSSFSRINEEDILSCPNTSSSATTTGVRGGAGSSSTPAAAGVEAWDAQSYRTPATPLSEHMTMPFSLPGVSTPSRWGASHTGAAGVAAPSESVVVTAAALPSTEAGADTQPQEGSSEQASASDEDRGRSSGGNSSRRSTSLASQLLLRDTDAHPSESVQEQRQQFLQPHSFTSPRGDHGDSSSSDFVLL